MRNARKQMEALQSMEQTGGAGDNGLAALFGTSGRAPDPLGVGAPGGGASGGARTGRPGQKNKKKKGGRVTPPKPR
jgi:hypothetical protein